MNGWLCVWFVDRCCVSVAIGDVPASACRTRTSTGTGDHPLRTLLCMGCSGYFAWFLTSFVVGVGDHPSKSHPMHNTLLTSHIDLRTKVSSDARTIVIETYKCIEQLRPHVPASASHVLVPIPHHICDNLCLQSRLDFLGAAQSSAAHSGGASRSRVDDSEAHVRELQETHQRQLTQMQQQNAALMEQLASSR